MSKTDAKQFINQAQGEKRHQAEFNVENVDEIINRGEVHGFEFNKAEFEHAVRELAKEELAREGNSEDIKECPTVCPMSTLMTA